MPLFSDIDPSNFNIPLEFELDIRVRYQETDGQGRVHHTNYINYFEIARVEMLRAGGVDYRALEATGVMLVVSEVKCNYLAAAQYDDLLRVKAKVVRAKGVRVTHEYEVYLGSELVCTGETTVAAVDKEGNVLRLPKWLRFEQFS